MGTVASGAKTINANPKERYLRDLSYIDTPAMVELDTNTDGTRDYRLWPTTDANHDVTALVTDQGVTVERYAYTPYGERIVLNGDQNYANTGADPDGTEDTVDTTGSDFGFLVGFQGLRQDPETGTWDERARPNSPVVSFQQRDPLLDDYQDGMSLYQLERSNPPTSVDPSGEDMLGPHGSPTAPGPGKPKPGQLDAVTLAAGIWNLPNQVIGGAMGEIGKLSGGKVSKHGDITEVTNIPWMRGGLTIGDTTIYGPGPHTNPDGSRDPGFGPQTKVPNGAARDHEAQHSKQSGILGPFYLPANLIAGLLGLLSAPPHCEDPWHASGNFMETGPQADPPKPFGK